jgi:hypothetical protein
MKTTNDKQLGSGNNGSDLKGDDILKLKVEKYLEEKFEVL